MLLFFPSFNAFGGGVHSRLSIIVVRCRVLTCDSGPESESANFYQLQLRLRPQQKRPTPTDSSSGLDPDSAALRTSFFFVMVTVKLCGLKNT